MMTLRRQILLFAGLFAAALLATLPLRLAVDDAGLAERGLAAREAEGSLWTGSFRDLQWGSLRLGDVEANARIVPLLYARLSLVLSGSGMRATAFATPSSAGVSGVSGIVPAAELLAPLPLTSIEMEDVSAGFGPRGCSGAGGFVRARLSGAAGGLVLPQALGGAPRCENGLLLLPLASPSRRESLDVRIDKSGRYEAALLVRPPDAAVGLALEAAGFRRTARGFTVILRGHLAGGR